MADFTRRSLLAGAGVGAAALAGCLGGGGGGDEELTETETETSTPTPTETAVSGPRLRHIDLINRDEEAHTVHVQVERGDEIVYWDVHDLGAASEGEAASALVEGSWDDGPGAVTIEARVDDGEVRTQTYPTAESDCIGVFAPISGGEIAFYDGAAACGGETTSG